MSDKFDGFFVDGASAGRRPVSVEVGADGLRISETSGAPLATWPYRGLAMLEDVYADQPARFRYRKEPGRLTVPDAAILQAIGRHRKRIKGADLSGHHSGIRAAKWAAGLVGVVLGFYFGLPLAAEPIASLVPRSWEEGLGERIQGLALGMFKADKSGKCQGAEGLAAIERLVSRLAKTTDTDYRFRVTVVNHKLVNAFAAPAGYIVVFRGLIDESRDAEAFAGVIAHEMGHVIERHGTEGVVKALGVGLVVSFLFGDSSSFTSVAADIATQLVSSSYGRAAEREADLIGVLMLNRAGIRGVGLAKFFEKIGRDDKEDDDGLSRYFATHPGSQERADTIRKAATGTGPAMSAGEWAAIRAMCR